MQPFKYTVAKDLREATRTGMEPGAKYIGGGTNLVDLMKMAIEQPAQLINLHALALQRIEKMPDGAISVGAMVSNTELAYHKIIVEKYPMLSQAILAGASPQLRNMATVGGNLLQKTRCHYFYDTVMPCNKRQPGAGCAAIKGYNRNNAVLGTSEHCIATHPSDMCVALAALEAVVHVEGINGKRNIAFVDFHPLPGNTPHIDHALAAGEIITHITIPPLAFAKHSTYVKVRDRASYDFALASSAVALDVKAGIIKSARIALGGVGTKPWRIAPVEQFLYGKKATLLNYKAAADMAVADAATYAFNAFKPALIKRTLISALQTIQPV